MIFIIMGCLQALGLKSAELMRSGEQKSVVSWLLSQLMRIMPGRMTEWIINRSTERINRRLMPST